LTFKTCDLYLVTFLLHPTGLLHHKFHKAQKLLMCCGWAVTSSSDIASDANSKPESCNELFASWDLQTGR